MSLINIPLSKSITYLQPLALLALLLVSSCLLSSLSHADQHGDHHSSWDALLQSEHRSADHKARDIYRHPKETLNFFEVKPDMTVVEIWPGSKGWYTELLAPYLKAKGKLYAAHFDPNTEVEFFRASRAEFLQKLQANPNLYDQVLVTHFDPPKQIEIAPAGTVDRVVTFRNAHNWYMRGGGEARLLASFKAFYRTLKPGGQLGLVDHRLPEAQPLSMQDTSGYMKQSYVIKIAEQAGFKLLASSEINANPKDTADHPKGVWTLPPSLRLKEQDRAKYLAIGESDRMTLRFIKQQ